MKKIILASVFSTILFADAKQKGFARQSSIHSSKGGLAKEQGQYGKSALQHQVGNENGLASEFAEDAIQQGQYSKSALQHQGKGLAQEIIEEIAQTQTGTNAQRQALTMAIQVGKGVAQEVLEGVAEGASYAQISQVGQSKAFQSGKAAAKELAQEVIEEVAQEGFGKAPLQQSQAKGLSQEIAEEIVEETAEEFDAHQQYGKTAFQNKGFAQEMVEEAVEQGQYRQAPFQQGAKMAREAAHKY